MDRQSVLQTLIAVVVSQSPLLVAYFIGAGVALGHWNRHRWAPALLLVGCLLLSIESLVLGTVFSLLPALLQERGYSGDQIGGMFRAVGFLQSVVSAIGVSFLIAAAWIQLRIPKSG